MMIKKLFTMTLVSLVTLTSCAKNSNDATAEVEQDSGTQGATVYFTKDISVASLVKIYEALGVETSGKRVAVKISTGESSRSNYLRPELIKDLVQKVGPTGMRACFPCLKNWVSALWHFRRLPTDF